MTVKELIQTIPFNEENTFFTVIFNTHVNGKPFQKMKQFYKLVFLRNSKYWSKEIESWEYKQHREIYLWEVVIYIGG